MLFAEQFTKNARIPGLQAGSFTPFWAPLMFTDSRFTRRLPGEKDRSKECLHVLRYLSTAFLLLYSLRLVTEMREGASL